LYIYNLIDIQIFIGALLTKCAAKKGDYGLITGSSGDVALYALQFAIAVGANVSDTSSDPGKDKGQADLRLGGLNKKSKIEAV
jgi:NADPH:quinone reductase-like Zn-dependent oxidoreductase